MKKLSKFLLKFRKLKEWFGKGFGVKVIIFVYRVYKYESGVV